MEFLKSKWLTLMGVALVGLGSLIQDEVRQKQTDKKIEKEIEKRLNERES